MSTAIRSPGTESNSQTRSGTEPALKWCRKTETIVAIAHPIDTARTIRGNFLMAHPNPSGPVSGNATNQELRDVGAQSNLLRTGHQLKALRIVVILTSIATFSTPLLACSTAGCAGDGIEMRRTFVVDIAFAG